MLNDKWFYSMPVTKYQNICVLRYVNHYWEVILLFRQLGTINVFSSSSQIFLQSLNYSIPQLLQILTSSIMVTVAI